MKTNGGTPDYRDQSGYESRTREAPYARGTDTHEMVFAYTTRGTATADTNRIEVNRNSISGNGAEVQSAQTKVEAVLDHDGTVVESHTNTAAAGARTERKVCKHARAPRWIAVRTPLALQHRDTGAQLPNRAGRPARGRGRLGECSRATDTGKQPGMAYQPDTLPQREDRDSPSGARMRRAKRCVHQQPTTHRSGIGNRAGRAVDGAVPGRAPRARRAEHRSCWSSR